MNQFLTHVSLFFRIATFKSPPQDVPATSAALYTGLCLAVAVSLLRYLVVGGAAYPVIRVVLEIVVPGLVLFILLMLFKLSQRFQQTFAAMCGSGAFIYIFALPILPIIYGSSDAPAYSASVYLIIALDIWSILVVANILKHAINVGIASGISFSIALGLLSLLVVESIAPTGRVESASPAQISLDADLSG